MKSRGTFVWAIISLICAISLYYKSSKNNVCKNYSDYLFIHSSKNCWHEPGLYAEVPQIILQRNLSLETYYTVTEDGYILKTFRILPRSISKGIILLEHSFIANSEMWVDKGDLSLGIYLINQGYEVWLGNLRGSKYSNTHISYTISDFEYWDWSFHEQGVYDIKSQLDLIKKVTNRNDTIFISYSMAGTSSVAYASVHAEHSKNSLKAIINIGPLVHVKRVSGALAHLGVALAKIKFWEFLHFLRVGYLPYGPVVNLFKSLACNSHPFKSLCLSINEPVIGFSKTEFDASTAPIILEKFPDGASTKIMLHYTQNHLSVGKLQFYDYGPDKNLRLYNSTEPPLYPLGNIKVPIFGYYGSEDLFTHKKDIEDFYNDLPPEAKIYGHKQVPNYNHFDLMFGKHREEDIYKHLLQLLEKVR